MKRIFIAVLLIGNLFYGFAQFNNYENGDIVNDFTVTDVNGTTHNLYSYTTAGKYVYLDFFYSACGGCRDFIPIFNELYDKYGCNEGDIICLAINSGYDKDDGVVNFENTYGGSFNHAPAVSLDGGCEVVITDFDPMYYPAVCLIAPDNSMVNSNISPYNSVADLENAFPSGFNPTPQNCSLNINSIQNSYVFSVSPNPVINKELTIDIYSASNGTLIIYNILGKELLFIKLTHSTQKIQVDLVSGIYLVKVKTKNGKTVKKLIVK
jgi:thiol-disulfide isomerase/thioredoxin